MLGVERRKRTVTLLRYRQNAGERRMSTLNTDVFTYEVTRTILEYLRVRNLSRLAFVVLSSCADNALAVLTHISVVRLPARIHDRHGMRDAHTRHQRIVIDLRACGIVRVAAAEILESMGKSVIGKNRLRCGISPHQNGHSVVLARPYSNPEHPLLAEALARPESSGHRDAKRIPAGTDTGLQRTYRITRRSGRNLPDKSSRVAHTSGLDKLLDAHAHILYRLFSHVVDTYDHSCVGLTSHECRASCHLQGDGFGLARSDRDTAERTVQGTVV